MDRNEAIQVLSILKAAYPNNYKGMTKQEAIGVVNIWASQFAHVPADIVMIALNKTIARKSFPPTIADVKEVLSSMHYEAVASLLTVGADESMKKDLMRIAGVCQSDIEPPLTELINAQRKRRDMIEAHDKQ